MATKRTSRVIVAALREVNVIRALFGMQRLRSMPKGIVDGETCPVANAVKGEHYATNPDVGPESIEMDNTLGLRMSFITPPAIRRFIYAFDRGRYPALKA